MAMAGYFVGDMRLTKLGLFFQWVQGNPKNGHFFDKNQSDNWHILVPML